MNYTNAQVALMAAAQEGLNVDTVKYRADMFLKWLEDHS